MSALSQRTRRRARGAAGPRLAVGFVLLAAMAWPAVLAQPGLAGQARVTIGLGGNLVAGAWNPVEVTLRDAAPSTLTMRIDAGDLLSGPRLVHYHAAVPGGSGITVFDDDIYVPAFHSLSWSVTSGDRVLASGSLGAREADGRRLQVVVSANPGAWRPAFGADARFVDVAASQLPVRAAAYDGVDTLLLDGTAAAPRADQVAAAAAGGADVLLVGSLPASQAGLARLAGGGSRRLGAGRVQRVPATAGAVEGAVASWRPLDRSALLSAVAREPLVRAPRSAPQPLVLSLAAGYALLLLLALRFGGTPGIVAGLALALVVSLTGWRLLRPPQAVLSANRTVMVSGGDLALALGLEERLTLPAGEVGVNGAARPLTSVPYSRDGDGTHVPLARWHGVSMALRPSLSEAALQLQGGRVRNAGSVPLHHVYVVGEGDQGTLEPGAARAIRPGEEATASSELSRLVALLPPGTVLAEAPGTLWVAPPDGGSEGGAR